MISLLVDIFEYLANTKVVQEVINDTFIAPEVFEFKKTVLLATLWISYGQPAHNKGAGYLFEFFLQSLSP